MPPSMQGIPLARYESVCFPRDGAALASVLGVSGTTGFRVWQEGAVAAELHLGRWTGGDGAALRRLLGRAGVVPDEIMDVEVFGSAAAGSRGAGVFVGTAAGGAMAPAGLYAGGTVFLCLNGPSFDGGTRGLLAERPGVVTFCVNNGGHGFRPDLWTCVDAPDRFMESIWADGRISKFVPVEFFGKSSVRDAPGPLVRERPNVWGYGRNDRFRAARFLREPTFNWGNHKSRGGGRSVMLVALRIAWELGFRRVVLVGCDFRMSAEERYWFAEGRTDQAIRNNTTTYGILEGFFAELDPVLREAGLRVVNATPGSGLRAFPTVDLAEEVERAAIDTTDSTEGMYVPRASG
ncbi:MAG: hypothetical protein WD342_00225 [Verrucomicrobiales bacterium]